MFFKAKQEPKAPEPFFRKGEKITIFGEHAATVKRDLYQGEKYSALMFDFHGKYALDEVLTVNLIRLSRQYD